MGELRSPWMGARGNVVPPVWGHGGTTFPLEVVRGNCVPPRGGMGNEVPPLSISTIFSC